MVPYYKSNIYKKKIGGINLLLLRCHNDPHKIIHISTTGTVLLLWKIMYEHNFSPYKTALWNCRYVVFRNKFLLYKKNVVCNALVGKYWKHHEIFLHSSSLLDLNETQDAYLATSLFVYEKPPQGASWSSRLQFCQMDSNIQVSVGG